MAQHDWSSADGCGHEKPTWFTTSVTQVWEADEKESNEEKRMRRNTMGTEYFIKQFSFEVAADQKHHQEAEEGSTTNIY